MRKTFAEYADDLVGGRRQRFKYSDALLARVAYTYVLQKTGLTTKELSERIVEPTLAGSRAEERDSSGIARKWEAGQLMSGKWQARLEPHASGLTAICTHPVFHLLGDFPITKNAADRCLSRWRGPQFHHWIFGDEEQRIVERRYVETWLRSDTQPLVERGDLDGFTVILGLMRYAEAANDSHAHVMHSRDLYRALPAVARIPWFKEHRQLLCYCVQRVHLRDTLSWQHWGVDWETINAQIDAEVHETIRYRCPRDARDGRFITPKDPVRPMVRWPDNKLIDAPFKLPNSEMRRGIRRRRRKS
jgi:hypothetical protein